MPARRELLIAIVLLPLLLVAAPAALAKKPPKPPPPPTSPADPAIVYREQGGYNLWVMNEDGSNATQIYAGKTWRMSWSPDGGSIAFTGDQELWRIEVDVVDGVPQGSNVTTLVDEADTTVFFPAWSPLGDEIAYLAHSTSSNFTDPGELRVVPASGGASQLLYAAPTGQRILGGTWSPDGARLAFLEKVEPDDEYRYIRILDVDTATMTTHELPVSDLHHGFYALDWARTGDVLAYEAVTRVPDRKNKTREAVVIHTLDLDAGNITPVVEGEMPSWSPDDSQLVMRARSRRSSGLYVYDFATGDKNEILGGSKWAPEWRR